MKNITNNSLWSKLTLLLNLLLLVLFVVSMLFLLKFDKTNVKVVEARAGYEKAYENYVMAQHPLKQDSAEVAYYQYKLDTLQQKLPTAKKDAKKTLEESISVTKNTLSEKKKTMDSHLELVAQNEAEYTPLKAEWDQMNEDNDKAKSAFIMIAVITLIVFLCKILMFATWNYKNSKNLHAIAHWMKDGMPAWMSYVSWLIPVYHLLKPLNFFKEIWDETDYVLEDKGIVTIPEDKKDTFVDNSGIHMGIWWILTLCSVWLMNFVLFKTFFSEGPLFYKANHGNMVVVAIVVLVLCLAEELYLLLTYNKKNKLLVDNADKF
ncbi:MAG: DUF4328 domain-containing protein [Bacteroidales bacterium]|nr:DUF4328 domain-containing protein [Bacteroidales bacterium]